MRNLATIFALIATLGLAPASFGLSIPPDQVNEQRVFWGDTDNFENPAEVDYRAAVKATPEYQEMKEEKVEKGTAKYWILLNSASERALRVIAEVAEASEYDLVVDTGFLGGLDPPLEGGNITEGVLDSIED